jgi:DNA-binding HxlR family transcriptional regulator
MAKRYDQYCAIAHALELVGERWSLLIVRELLTGPKRYTDLSGSLLASAPTFSRRASKELEAGGILTKRRLLRPGAGLRADTVRREPQARHA